MAHKRQSTRDVSMCLPETPFGEMVLLMTMQPEFHEDEVYNEGELTNLLLKAGYPKPSVDEFFTWVKGHDKALLKKVIADPVKLLREKSS